MNDTAQKISFNRRWKVAFGVSLLILIAGVTLGEWLGWPFLATPLQRLLTDKLDRRVLISANTDTNTAHSTAFQVRFVGGISLYVPQLEIGAPAWSSAPHLILAREFALKLRYADLWHAYRGGALRIHSLQASMLDGYLERLADGRASWQFGPQPSVTAAQPLPLFDHLEVIAGTVRYTDAPLIIDAAAKFSLVNGASVEVARKVPVSNTIAATSQPNNVLQINASGHYRDLPLKVDLATLGVLPWVVTEAQAVPVSMTLNATVGSAHLNFKGSMMDVLHLNGVSGQFKLNGSSLADVGQPVGVTLPTTAAFRAEGMLTKQGNTWRVEITDASVGTSSLNGNFIYEVGRNVPLLSGNLGGRRLVLADLGPVVGTMPVATELTETPQHTQLLRAGKVLPDRPFDLPSLRAMDADVLIDISEVNLNTTLLEPLRPLRAHLVLKQGVLTVSNLNARTGQGKLMGKLRLDGRAAKALWNADLRWEGIRLESWISQRRSKGAPPYISGKLNGSARVTGQGRTTAEILGSLQGQARTELLEGKVSHLAVELSGLDLAESLGVLIKGDNVLPVQCAVADLIADGGVFRPRVMVVDTTDTAVWVEGSLSMASEAIDLRAVVTPKDFSPLTLRTPLLVRGTFAQPKVSIEKKPLEVKLASAFLLSLINPLAALIPFIDVGNSRTAKRDTVGCQNLMERSKSSLPVATADQ